MTHIITTSALRAAGANAVRAELWLEPLRAAADAYGITTPRQVAAFLPQLGHESTGFKHTTEIWGPTPVQRRYEGRADLGNTQPGDGARYKGHGLIQVTGRANHAAARDRMREKFGPQVPDFEAHPELLAEREWAAMSAADYWHSRRLNWLADADNFELITRRINGGLNGYEDRLAKWHAVRAVMGLQ